MAVNPKAGDGGRGSRRSRPAATSSSALALPTTDDARPHRPIATRATYRQLMMRGLDAPAAGNLTAYLAGLPIVEQPWSLAEVNRMLFLRDLAQRGRWTASGLDRMEFQPAV